MDLMADHLVGINAYQFGFNNPVNFNDPSGLFPGQELLANVGNLFNKAFGIVLSDVSVTAARLIQSGVPIVFNSLKVLTNNTILRPANPCQSCQEQISSFYKNQARYTKFIQQGQERDPFVFGGGDMGMGFARTMGETIKQAPYVILPELAGARVQTLLWKLTPKLINASEGVTGLKFGVKGETTVAYADRTFDIIDWSGYPNYAVPKPVGPFRDISGTAEYITALREKEVANRLIRSKGFTNFEVDVHEIHPVFLSGHATSTMNKLIINRKLHSGIVTPWWARKATEAKRLHETMLRF